MTELWSDDKKDLEIKAKIISECAYLPEFFTEFPDKDLPKEDLKERLPKYFRAYEQQRVGLIIANSGKSYDPLMVCSRRRIKNTWLK